MRVTRALNLARIILLRGECQKRSPTESGFFHRRRTIQRPHDEAIHLLTDPFGRTAKGYRPPGVVTLEASGLPPYAGRRDKTRSSRSSPRRCRSLTSTRTSYARFERRADSLPAIRGRLLASVQDEIHGSPPPHPPLPQRQQRRLADEPPDYCGAYCAMIAEACTAKAQEKDPAALLN